MVFILFSFNLDNLYIRVFLLNGVEKFCGLIQQVPPYNRGGDARGTSLLGRPRSLRTILSDPGMREQEVTHISIIFKPHNKVAFLWGVTTSSVTLQVGLTFYFGPPMKLAPYNPEYSLSTMLPLNFSLLVIFPCFPNDQILHFYCATAPTGVQAIPSPSSFPAKIWDSCINLSCWKTCLSAHRHKLSCGLDDYEVTGNVAGHTFKWSTRCSAFEGSFWLFFFWKVSFIVIFLRGMFAFKEDLSYLTILISRFTGGLFGHVHSCVCPHCIYHPP